jgi:hypothetical protein
MSWSALQKDEERELFVLATRGDDLTGEDLDGFVVRLGVIEG